MASVTPICQDPQSAPSASQPDEDGNTNDRRFEVVQESKLRKLPSHHQAVTELSQAQQSILELTARHEIQDEAIQTWYDSAPNQTPTDRVYRSTEILTHDRDQAHEATMVYRRAAGIAQRAGDADLAAELEAQAVQFQLDLVNAEFGLRDLRRTIDLV